MTELERLILAVLSSTVSRHTHRAYQARLDEYAEWHSLSGHQEPVSHATITEYLNTLANRPASIVRMALAALRRLHAESQGDVLATIRRRGLGVKQQPRMGVWLSEEQAAALLAQPDTRTLLGKRDRVMLGLLLECGLRREEACTVQVGQYQLCAGRWCLLDLAGKGKKRRTVPIPRRLADHIHTWLVAASINRGPLLRSVNRGGNVGEWSLSPAAIYKRVLLHAHDAKLDIAPHDLRRTFGRLTRARGAELDQIRLSLGHSSVRTTEIYLGCNQDLAHAPCDTLDLEISHGQSPERSDQS